jgi:hypothetical protein
MGITPVELERILAIFAEATSESGKAVAGTITTLTDTTKNWPVDHWQHAFVSLTLSAFGGIEYTREVVSNTADTLTFNTLPLATSIVAGDTYKISVDLGVLAWLSGYAVPTAKAALFNAALPAANADWLVAAIAPTFSPSYLRIYVCVAAAGLFYVRRTVGGVAVDEYLNMSNNLVANSSYLFTVPWRAGDTMNFRYSVTAANILCFRAEEITIAA